MRTREDVICKIQKLLNLADKSRNNSDAEAAEALLAAQRLMAKYDIEIAQLDDMDTDPIESEACQHADNLGYRVRLARVIAKNFKVRTYMRGNTVMFYGYKTDTKSAKCAFEFAYRYIYRVGNRICDGIRKNGQSAKGVFNSYALGFIQGIDEAFAVQCKALLIVVPAEVNAAYSDMSEKWAAYSGGVKQHVLYSDYYETGRHDGIDQFGIKLINNE